jgi:copper chaperone
MKNVSFEIEGMSCGSCVRHVTDALRRMDGVDVKRVEIGSAELTFDAAKTSPAAIAGALTQVGYPATERAGAVAVKTGCETSTKSGGGCCCG